MTAEGSLQDDTETYAEEAFEVRFWGVIESEDGLPGRTVVSGFLAMGG